MSTGKTPIARVTRRFAAPAERVFDAWLNPVEIGQFLFGPQVRDEEIVHLRVDARVGGEFSFLVRRNAVELDHIGRYLAIERSSHLAFTWAVAPQDIDASRVDIRIEESGDGAELKLEHELAPGWEDWVEKIQGSWRMMLDKLGETVEGK